ncbi:MAG: hypothetical protein HYS32_03095 [Candidatus Woesearchaeota archaeon]|nr:MAG: hypothetical protein HYS32_03095 [Candidatus Woesearchaeota archaeon]
MDKNRGVKKYLPYHTVKFYVFLVIFIVIGATLGYYYRYTDCKSDVECFNSLAKQCKRAKVLKVQETNFYEFNSKGVNFLSFNQCLIDVKVIEVRSGDLEIIKLFENTGMSCKISKEQEIEDYTVMGSILKFCHGTLKEALYEKTIRELYGDVVRNLGNIVTKATEVLGNVEK